MSQLGQLERRVMELAWDDSLRAPDATFTVRDLAERLPGHAYTTVLTVVDRLHRKGMLQRVSQDRANHFRAADSREGYVASLMQDALASTSDSAGVLVRFARTVSAEQADLLRAELGRIVGGPEPAPPRARRTGARKGSQ